MSITHLPWQLCGVSVGRLLGMYTLDAELACSLDGIYPFKNVLMFRLLDKTALFARFAFFLTNPF